MNHHDAWLLLDELLDGALAAGARWAVLAHLEACSVCRAHVAAQARLRGQVRARLANITPPAGLTDRLRSAIAAEAPALHRRSFVPSPPAFAMQLLALLAPAFIGLWLLARATAPVATPPIDNNAELAISHALFGRNSTLLDVTGDADTIATWFRDESGLQVSPPELDGYELVGARMILLAGRPVAQIVYESEDDVYLSLLRFERRPADIAQGDDGGFVLSHYGTMPLVTWSSGNNQGALVGMLPEDELSSLAEHLAAFPDDPTTAPSSALITPSASSLSLNI